MSAARMGNRLAVWVAAVACLALCLNGAVYLFDLVRWGALNQWEFGELQGWGFRFLFHALVTALALALLVPAWLYMRFGTKSPLPKSIPKATAIGVGLYVIGASLEIYLPHAAR